MPKRFFISWKSQYKLLLAVHVSLAKNEEFSTVITNQDHNYRVTNQEVTLISFWLLISNKSSPRMSIKQLDEKKTIKPMRLM